jgi:hypothetical protein
MVNILTLIYINQQTWATTDKQHGGTNMGTNKKKLRKSMQVCILWPMMVLNFNLLAHFLTLN